MNATVICPCKSSVTQPTLRSSMKNATAWEPLPQPPLWTINMMSTNLPALEPRTTDPLAVSSSLTATQTFCDSGQSCLVSTTPITIQTIISITRNEQVPTEATEGGEATRAVRNMHRDRWSKTPRATRHEGIRPRRKNSAESRPADIFDEPHCLLVVALQPVVR